MPRKIPTAGFECVNMILGMYCSTYYALRACSTISAATATLVEHTQEAEGYVLGHGRQR